MKTAKILLMMILFSSALVSCGGDGARSSDLERSEEEFNSQFLEGDCGLDVVSDYNSMVLECQNIYSESDLVDCENKVDMMISKYPNINCSATKGYGLDEEKFQITEQLLFDLKEELEKL